MTSPLQGATDAIPLLNRDLFDRRCEELGATTEEQKAALVKVNPSTIHRFRKGEIGPRLEVARRIARALNVSVDDLWPDLKAAP